MMRNSVPRPPGAGGEYFPPVTMAAASASGGEPVTVTAEIETTPTVEPVMATATLTVSPEKYTVGQQFAPIVVGAARGIWQAVVFAAGITGVALGSGVPDEYIVRIALGALLLGIGGRTAESALFDQFISKTVKRDDS